MILLVLSVVFICCITVNTRYTLYYSDIRQGSYPTFDCLYAYLIDGGKETGKPYIQNYHLIPYCQRLDDEEEQDEMINLIDENIVNKISFKKLKEKNITSEQLLQWFAPIDIAEKYQMNQNDSDIFHNCSLPWFGSRCQYKLNSDLSLLSFGDIVDATFSNQRGILSNFTGGTCYRFLNGCNHGLWPLCLHWHEICDGKFDCLNGEDEQRCNELEIHKCNSNEYRCHYGGQCISLSFFKDSRLSIDCLDGSDEIESRHYNTLLMNQHCLSVSTFRCQERISRYHQLFSCGDGQYLTLSFAPFIASYCTNNRDKELSRFMLTSFEHISNKFCQQSFYCALYFNKTLAEDLYEGNDIVGSSVLINDVWENDCKPLSEHCLSEWVVLPAYPIIYGFFQLVYLTNRSVDEFKINKLPDYICFRAQYCPALLINIVSIEIINGLTCSVVSNLIGINKTNDLLEMLSHLYVLGERCLKSGIDKSCSNSSYFHCNQSLKCILYHHVGDGKKDCLYGEDELFDTCQFNDSNRFICSPMQKKCLMPVAVGNGLYDCTMGEDEVFTYTKNFTLLIPFSILCDHSTDYYTFYDTSDGTDEDNCHWWPCDNPYTHCNREWDCSNGIDELNCHDSQCSFNEYECQNQELNLTYCLSRSQIYEKYHFNCFEAVYSHRNLYFYNGTDNITADYESWDNQKCITSEKLCHYHNYSNTIQEGKEVCLYQTPNSFLMKKNNVKFIENDKDLCTLDFKRRPYIIDLTTPMALPFFKVSRLGNFPYMSINHSISTISKTIQKKKINPTLNTIFSSYCHRGISVLTGPNQTIKCFCPPNYFGSQCQWQNQRVSLTLQLSWRGTTSINLIFQVIIMLIDQHEHISPYYEQITYMPNRDCNTKFNIYLLYPDRPKSLSNNYSIRIDVYEKIKLNYWASWHVSIPFQFLPVNRITTQLMIPEIQNNEKCTLTCGEHGRCMRYVNKRSLYFCQCNKGYSGTQCQIKHKCNCSIGSFCFNSSICICPLHKFGQFCHLTHSICQSSNNPCKNNGLCIPIDDRIGLKQFTCFCSNDYSGERCENKNNRIDIHLNETILSNISLLLLHFITAFENAEHERTTILRKIPFNDKNLTVYTTQSFNILFTQTIPNQYYYLVILRETFLPSEHIYTDIQPNQRCPSINEFNKTLSQYGHFYRTKYYPLFCRQRSELMCFYDIDYMCICDTDRFSNCFTFNHAVNNICQDYNYCLNGGHCFQNNETCPTKLTCICSPCYYGSKCQFSTKGFITSLDSILAYHIKPNLSINEQLLIIKISIAITTIMFIIGLINGLSSIMIFRRKKPRQVGTGYYLFYSSIVSILLIILLIIKFWLLILSQISLITNRSFLKLNCISLDVSLTILSVSNEWLNACVALERMITVIKDTRFNKSKSRKFSKWMIIIVFILATITHIHDPIHRKLIEDLDIDETRIWCFTQYSSSFEIYNTFITLFHFFVPFLINIISAVWIIISLAYTRTDIQPTLSFQQHLSRQIREHRQLIVAPCILVLISLPRLIISFVSGCMRSARQPWIYLLGYFLSFTPSMLTFVIFVLPSTNYRKEFHTIVQRTMKRFQSISSSTF